MVEGSLKAQASLRRAIPVFGSLSDEEVKKRVIRG